jgi:protease I
MAAPLEGRRVAILAADGTKRAELTELWRALEGAGSQVELLSAGSGDIRVDGAAFPVNHAVADAKPTDYAGLIVLGGPGTEALRSDSGAVGLVRNFMEYDKPVGVVGEGVRLLADAGVLRGRTVSAPASLEGEVRGAGADWSDRKVHVDQKLVTCGDGADMGAFGAKVVALFGEAIDESRLDRMVEQSFPASDPLPGPTAVGGQGVSDTPVPEQRAP